MGHLGYANYDFEFFPAEFKPLEVIITTGIHCKRYCAILTKHVTRWSYS